MTADFLPQIDLAICIGCELCVKLCPNNTLAMVQDIPTVSAPEACTYTGACQEICPSEAISLTYEIVFSRGKKNTQGGDYDTRKQNC